MFLLFMYEIVYNQSYFYSPHFFCMLNLILWAIILTVNLMSVFIFLRQGSIVIR